MVYSRTSSPSRIITLDEAKSQLNILNTSQDTLISGMINIAEDVIMARTNQVFSNTTFVGSLTDFEGDAIYYPVTPVTGVSLIQVKDTRLDTLRTLEQGVDYFTSSESIQFSEYVSFYEVNINFSAGHSEVTLPSALRGAALMLIGTLFANRQSEKASVVEKIPYGIEFMIQPHVYWRF